VLFLGSLFILETVHTKKKYAEYCSKALFWQGL